MSDDRTAQSSFHRLQPGDLFMDENVHSVCSAPDEISSD